MNAKLISNILFALSFLLAILLFTDNTFGYKLLIRGAFLATGGIALLLSLVASRTAGSKNEFNLLFWIGSLVIYIGFVMRFQHFPGSEYPLIGGLAISAISNFYNPFLQQKNKDEDLLDN